MAQYGAAERRDAIVKILEERGGPVSATALAGQLSVSRQVIVGDVALLRAAGCDILATPRGYSMVSATPDGLLFTVACIHGPEDMGKELYAIVDAGGEAVDVVVEHPVYGQLTGMLGVRSRYDVEEFLGRVKQNGARPLSELTGGIHLHTLRCPNQETGERVRETLKQAGFLLSM